MQQWEHWIQAFSGGSLDKSLGKAHELSNQLGQQGWELVSMQLGSGSTVVVAFKRPRSQ